MESSAAAIGAFNWHGGNAVDVRLSLELPGISALGEPKIKGIAVRKFISSRCRQTPVSCSKATEVKVSPVTDSIQEISNGKHYLQNLTFPDGFEALVLGVCDESSVAELKIKVGDFRMHLKRNVDAPKAPLTISSPAIVPTDSSEISQTVTSLAVSSVPKSVSEKIDTFVNPSVLASAKLAALEATGSSGYKLVLSPTVGSFRKGRTVKGRKQPPICKEGDYIRQDQIIGYVDQFGTELPVKSNVAGKLLKLLFAEGEAVGYGDPLVALVP